jgi:hypothetical protein
MYRHLENFSDQRSQKVARFLTLEMLVGVFVVVGPVFFVTQHTSPLLRALAVLLAIALGVLVTVDIGGLPLYARVLWRVRGQVRGMMTGTVLQPETLALDAAVAHTTRAVRRDSPVQPLLRRRGTAAVRATAVTGQRVAQRAAGGARSSPPSVALRQSDTTTEAGAGVVPIVASVVVAPVALGRGEEIHAGR